MTTVLLDASTQLDETESQDRRLADRLRMIRAEYLEMPGLHLTRKQAQRLWNLDSSTCNAALGTLVTVGFLRRTDADGFVRAGWAATDDSPL